MALPMVHLGSLEVTRLAIGGNPFSGFSHQGPARDREMRGYYTTERIKRALHKAEEAGINTFVGRADNHVMRLLEEYRAEGGRIQWIAQTASEQEDYLRNISVAAEYGARGIYMHGGVVDHHFGNRETGHFGRFLQHARSLGLAAGFAGHTVESHCWIRDNLSPDFQLCSYYDPSPRSQNPHHVASEVEVYEPAHRDAMVRIIQTLKAPAVHYKVLAAGRTPAREALEFAAPYVRAQDVVLIGFYLGDDDDMIGRTVRLFESIVR